MYFNMSACLLPWLIHYMFSCSVPFVQTNVQLLATCYLHNNQPYAAYHILKGNIICSRYYHPAVPGHYCVVMSLRFESKQLEYIVHFVGIFLILHFGLFFSFYIGMKVVWMIYGFFFYCIWREEAARVPVLVCYVMLSNEPLAWSRRYFMSSQWTKHWGMQRIC